MMDLSAWTSQLSKGATELAVLATLIPQPRYGREICEILSTAGALKVSEGTLYPLVNRLHREGKVASQWVEDEGASHPRKYYSLTAEGRKTVEAMTAEWKAFAKSMNIVIRQGERDARTIR